jgi:phosphoribosylanthranilate isomerase
MLVKICGITNLADALAAVAAGAGALGFNFYVRSSRYLDAQKARAIIDRLPAGILKVGVFVNEASPEVVQEIATAAGVDAVQLHGDESPEFCAQLKHPYVIKALSVGDNFEPEQALDYDVKAILLDAYDRTNRGGTGHTFDWSIARRTRELVPRLFLAGGLSAKNVAEAIRVVEPYAVDACSSLEMGPGKKDRERVKAFVKAALE